MCVRNKSKGTTDILLKSTCFSRRCDDFIYSNVSEMKKEKSKYDYSKYFFIVATRGFMLFFVFLFRATYSEYRMPFWLWQKKKLKLAKIFSIEVFVSGFIMFFFRNVDLFYWENKQRVKFFYYNFSKSFFFFLKTFAWALILEVT